MLYHLFTYLHEEYNLWGAGVFNYISFRSAAAVTVALLTVLLFGKRLIRFLARKQIGETIRDLGLDGQMSKQGTPTMGGLLILGSLLIAVLLFCDLTNIYVQLMLLTTVWLGIIGFVDDYIKVFRKNKEGLKGKFKILGQVGLGLAVGLCVCFSDDIVVREFVNQTWQDVKSTSTSIPFFKDNELDYSKLITWIGDWTQPFVWIVVVLAVIFIITATSNGANLTDGLDGLAAGTSSIVGVVLGIFAYLTGHFNYAGYLNIMYIPNSGELVVFISAFVGAMIGFLWYNTYPAQIFMGDTGSLAIGGIVAVFAILIRKELLLPLICGIFLVESFSVILQTTYFKYTKRKYGAGRRIFLMSPLHHHYQKKGMHEAKIVSRFMIVGILLAVLAVVTLKIR